uniref:hypothetical protein n=1 Tax=Enterococcus mundtii TaxID=53346 RepID=UPI0021B14A3D|nr:hypothetical protein [Enterococcus mundtii]
MKVNGRNKKMYSNSIDFGDYDYSGNHNLAITNSDTFKSGTGGPVTYLNGEYTVHMDGSGRLSRYNVNSETSAYLKDKTQYTMSCEIYVGSDYTGDITQIFANYAYTDGGYSILQTSRLPSDAPRNTWITVSGTSTIDYQGRVPKVLYFTWQTVSNTVNPTGTLKIRKLKIEHGADATSYQPNLLQEPYQVSKVATPPISFYKYFGEGLKDSNDPNDYSWDVTSAYTEKSLNEKVSLTEPQSIAGTKNFLEQPLISGERISTEKFGVSLTGGQLTGVPVSDGTVLNWGRPYAYDNERSKMNDLFTISEDAKSLTILKSCALQFIGKFTCQTNNASYYAYLGMRVNGASDWRVAGIGGTLNWRNDVGWFCVREFNVGDVVTLVTGTNYTTDSVNAWGVDQVYIREILTA